MKRYLALVMMISCCMVYTYAQDDMYFVPNKTTKAEKAKRKAEYEAQRRADLEAKSRYYRALYGDRSVDEYNRRGQFNSEVVYIDSTNSGNDIIVDSVVSPSNGSYDLSDDYKYSRRMSRFDDYDYYYNRWYDDWETYNLFYGYTPSWAWNSRYYYGFYSPWYYSSYWYSPWRYSYYYDYYGWHHPWYYGYTYHRPVVISGHRNNHGRTGINGGRRVGVGYSTSSGRSGFSSASGNNSSYSGRSSNSSSNSSFSSSRSSSSYSGGSFSSGSRGGGASSGGSSRGGGRR